LADVTDITRYKGGREGERGLEAREGRIEGGNVPIT